MSRSSFAAVSLIALLVCQATPILAQDKDLPENARKAKAVVEAHLQKLKAQNAEILWKSEDALKKSLPDDVFFAVRFRQFPVARILPEGLNASNIFAVDAEQKLHHLKDRKALENYFRSHQKKVADDAAAKQVLAAWLALSQEFHQDGMFRFEVTEKGFAVEKGKKGLEAAGRAIVMQGGNGELSATLEFVDGKLAAVTESAKIRPGPRPICQATKLLDPDPIVRKMAEQDLLIMGVSARSYLMEQRGQARPELREAIDRLWSKIEQNGW